MRDIEDAKFVTFNFFLRDECIYLIFNKIDILLDTN